MVEMATMESKTEGTNRKNIRDTGVKSYPAFCLGSIINKINSVNSINLIGISRQISANARRIRPWCEKPSLAKLA